MRAMMGRAGVLLLTVALAAGCAGTGSSGSRDERTNPRSDAAVTNTQLAAGYVRQGRLELALEKIKRAVELDPNLAQAHSVAGVIYERIGDTENAERHYSRAVRLDGTGGQALNNYGQFLCKVGKFAAGIEYLDRAIDDPFYKTPAIALSNAGRCAEGLGQTERAERYFRQALEFDREYPDALFYLSRLLLGEHEAFRARAFIQRYESVSEPSPQGLSLALRIECELQNREAVEQYASRLRKLFPDSTQAKALGGSACPDVDVAGQVTTPATEGRRKQRP